VQGRLRNEFLSAEIRTECGHCGRPIELWVDSELRWGAADPQVRPLIFEPNIDWSRFGKSSIIDDY
jgi:hypothetical protein